MRDSDKTVMSGYALAPTMFLIEEEDRMLILNDEQRLLARVASLGNQFQFWIDTPADSRASLSIGEELMKIVGNGSGMGAALRHSESA